MWLNGAGTPVNNDLCEEIFAFVKGEVEGR